MNELELPALDGANPLGFLAALGTLAVLSDTDPTLKLGWHARARWTPYLTSSQTLNDVSLVAALVPKLRGKAVRPQAERKREVAQERLDAEKKRLKDAEDELRKLKLKGNQLKAARARRLKPIECELTKRRKRFLAWLKAAVPSPELALGQRPDCTIEEFRAHARSFLAEVSVFQRRSADMLAAFGAESAAAPDERIQPTPFCFITGSGHQWFLDTARQLMAHASKEKLREALFEPWSYRDKKLTMRWDPLDDRRYALMDRDPTASDNKSTTVWMANLLGYFGLSYFPSALTERGVATASWSTGRQAQSFHWPIWSSPLSSDSVRSLLTHRALSVPDYEGERRELRARGVAAVFSARRIQVGNPPLHKINFSPASAL